MPFHTYAPDEALTNDDLIREKYRGIRPAPGYPACPDHSQKPELFRLLNAGQNAGMTLTESFAMIPISAVSGCGFSVGLHRIAKVLLAQALHSGDAPATVQRCSSRLLRRKTWRPSQLEPVASKPRQLELPLLLAGRTGRSARRWRLRRRGRGR
jgi:5-methyltetrahydrofolate--homocysteine methyltransferase